MGSLIFQTGQNELVIIFCTIFVALVIVGLLVMTRVNTQSISALLGCLVGLGIYYTMNLPLTYFQYSMDPWSAIALYYPLYLTRLVFCVDYVIYKKTLWQMLLVIVCGYPISMIMVGCIISVTLDVGLELTKMILTGLIPTSIDVPDSSFKLEHMQIMEGLLNMEAIFGNAISFTILGLTLGVYDGIIVEWYQGIAFILRDVFLALFIGWCFGGILKIVFKIFYNDSYNACTFMLCASYSTFFLCERVFFCNGIIACFLVIINLSQKKCYISKKTMKQIENYLDSTYFLVVRIGYFVFFVKFTYNIVPENDISITIGAAVLYMASTACRFLMFLLLFPALRKMGHGFGFTSLITIFWAPKKGPVQIMMSSLILQHPVHDYLSFTIFGYWYYYLVYVNIVNVTTVGLIMKKMGILDLSIMRRNNIANCFKYVNEKRKNQIELLKMNKFYSGVNWSSVYSSTVLVCSLNEVDTDEIEEKPTAICPNCSNEIPTVLTKEDIMLLTREAQLRILKTEKVSFVYQFEEELISEECVRMLLLACETALDAEEPTIKLDDLIAVLRNKHLTGPLSVLQKNFLYRQEYFMLPMNNFYRRCYKIASFKYFEVIFFCLIVFNILTNILTMIYYDVDRSLFVISIALINVYYLIYFLEFLIKLYAHSCINTRQGFKNFWKFYWNRVDFILLLFNSIEMIVLWVLVVLYMRNIIGHFRSFIGYVQMAKAIRLVRIFKVLGLSFSSISRAFDRINEYKLVSAYAMGTALVIGFEEVLDTLGTITNNSELRETLRVSLLADKSLITRELGTLNNEKPWIVIYLKTLQAISVILKTMNDALVDLNMAGLVDNYEYRQLWKVIEKLRKNTLSIDRVNAVAPKDILYEVPYVRCDGFNEDEMLELINKGVIVKVWEAGEVVCTEGQTIDGIYLLITGLLKSTYIPSEEYLEELEINGKLPIKDYIRNSNFADIEENFYMVGNSMGELSVLTGRPYSCKITTELPSHAFIIPTEVVKMAMTLSDDPIFGLECRIWKCISIQLVRRILKATTVYSTKSNMELNLILNRAFVPDLRCFSLFVVNKYIEDIILIEGLIVDANTRELITAPSYVPRNVHKMKLYRDTDERSLLNNKTKLMLIPIADVDEYEVILHSEEVSELVPHHSSVCLLSGKNIHRPQQRRRVGVRNMYQAINSISVMQ